LFAENPDAAPSFAPKPRSSSATARSRSASTRCRS